LGIGSLAIASLVGGCGGSPYAARLSPTTTEPSSISTTTMPAPTTTMTAPTTTTQPPPVPGVVADCLTEPDSYPTSIKPTSIVLACADDGIRVEDVSWTSWMATTANGAGTIWENDCTPSCADGTFHYYPASITLSGVKSSIEGPVFSQLVANYEGQRPNGMATEQFSLFAPPEPTPTCGASELQASVIPTSTSGNFSFTYVQFTDASAQPCHMEGFPGFDLIDASGSSIINASRGCTATIAGECPTTPYYISLSANGGYAFFSLVWQSTPAAGQTCPESTSVLITPPNAYDHLTLPLRISVCGQPLSLGVGTVGYAR
jgi:hypothetical protein